jgi:acyl carrier protein
MANLKEKIKELLEIEELNLNAKFKDLEEWDSLSVLSTLALLDSDYKINMSQQEVEAFPSIAEFIEYVEKNGK